MTPAMSSGALAPASPPEATQAGGPGPKLDELMLAMDVVDTLRHEDGLAAKELGQADPDRALNARLRQLAQQTRIELTETLPRDLQAAADAALAEAKVADAQVAARRLLADGQAALASGNPAGAREAIAQLAALRARLVQQYVLRIVRRPGE